MPPSISQMIHSIVILKYQPLKKLSKNSIKDIAIDESITTRKASKPRWKQPTLWKQKK